MSHNPMVLHAIGRDLATPVTKNIAHLGLLSAGSFSGRVYSRRILRRLFRQHSVASRIRRAEISEWPLTIDDLHYSCIYISLLRYLATEDKGELKVIAPSKLGLIRID